MVRYKATIAYDGTNFSGFQSQINGRTVQDEIEKTLSKIANQAIKIRGSGRTDAGVHALGQVIDFSWPFERVPEKLRFALDTQTPADIAINQMELVSDDFHSRYQAKEKIYEFRVDIGKPRSPFRRFYSSYYPYELDVEKIKRALPDFLGTHDFTSFCSGKSVVKNKTRTIYEATMEMNEDKDEIVFTFRGDGFLYNMVRIMIGTLLKIGNGRISPDAIPQIIAACDRNAAGPTAHPEGLYLKEVKY
ncbi:tRNA pseudouridine(38-40) synthase TruA [Tetragenococcus osmophilus]|uniref:tRNA pseudouridine synthase A n=1 Tax=Tetragenococcus osmophilus TaxID=526944 RepID=A0AA37XM93_9ENTE|nr:tRNA pseudouridine(38-40) synthase TruA [Tetragenococcus osmophilus]AYW47903.1 tRNA pseudouridine(38-40) synthase TruA [Tetragenococcus osmophilus]GMA53606.1 tRNA pseudouridine synthase A [Alicyclobacillus contaminans]GMA72455.1 tRNA pseudouridine synthase A [Tetragenococcus osmophilus]